jgi:SpoIID/LytB domain protein
MKVGLMSAFLRRPAGRFALLLTVALVAIVLPPGTAQAAGGDATFVGHGWGHGRGMGQYGALGYAVNYGWSSAQILDHFYGGTVAGTAGNPEMTVELTGLTGRDTIVTGNGLAINGVAAGAVAVLIRRTASGTFQVYAAPGCGGPWIARSGSLASGLTISASGTQSVLGNLVRVCELTGERAYRGSLSVVNYNSTQLTINHLPTESYLRGVVPRESPASWSSLGGGKGMQALRAQAVAARSYALASSRPSGARTCDTTACQVYGGAGFKTGAGLTALESGSTDTAISGTAYVVRLKSGAVARTEFSSSTGGYTAGGAFPAVVDAGDSVASNPNHTWVTTSSFSVVAAKLGTGAIGSMAVTARNGLGAEGGRVTNVRVVSTAGVVRDFSGNQVRAALGLKSDWFSISGFTPAQAEQVVRALYQDVLGRGPDPAGLANWTSAVLTTGNAQVVARGLIYSPERMNTLVVALYRSALLRDPEPAGRDSWVRNLEASRSLTSLQVSIYGSPESLQRLGRGDLRAWAGALYVALLGRTASVSERQYWVDFTALHGRAAVVASIARSDEAGMRRLTVYYQTFLQRGVDPSGRGAFLSMMAGRGDFDVPLNLGISSEYWNRAQSRTF